jgi:predicted dehydrogenase
MIQAGIVGLGWWGERLLEAARPSAAHLRFVHGVSPRPTLRQALAARHGLRLSASIAEMLRDPAVQAVVLATPHSLHADQIVQIAASGRPVLCEKPLTLTRAEAERAIAACAAAGVLLAVAHNRRFLPAVAELASLAEAGTLGRLLHIEGHLSNENSAVNFAGWRHAEAESPAGGLTGTGVHMLEAFTHLAGPVRRVQAQLVRWQPPPGALDSLSVLLEFRNGMTGTLAGVRATPRFWRLHLFGTAGNAENHDETGLVLRLPGQPPARRTLPEVDTLRAELEAFATALEGGAPYPITPRQMLDTVSVFEAITRSVAAGGAPEEVA